MPSLSSMRSLDPAGDSFQPLGPAVKPAAPATATPAGKPTGTPGVVQMPDGKLQTQLLLPPVVRVHDSFVFPSYTKADFEREFMQDFYAVEQRALGSGRINAGRKSVSNAPKPGREPQVGDWVRILSGQDGIKAIDGMVGSAFPVSEVIKSSDGSINIIANTWCFRAPGHTHSDGSLLTEFVGPLL